jgi:hypothetical protein
VNINKEKEIGGCPPPFLPVLNCHIMHAYTHIHTHTQRSKVETGNWKPKTRKPGSLCCENENKARWKSKSIKYKAVDFLLSYFVPHLNQMQLKTTFLNRIQLLNYGFFTISWVFTISWIDWINDWLIYWLLFISWI